MGIGVTLLLPLIVACVVSVYALASHRTAAFEETGHTVNYTKKGLRTVPSNIPEDTTVLDLSYNPIQKIQGHEFRNLTALVKLDLSNCEIVFIGKGSFHSQTRLELLDLSNNSLSDVSFTNGTFRGMSSLKNLNLKNNNINVTTDVLCEVPTITTLGVKGMKGMIFPHCFQTFQFLEVIAFSPCCIEQLSNKTFMYLTNSKIRNLDLSSCGLKSAETGVFKPFQDQLETLDLSDNDSLRLRTALHSLFGLQHGNMTSINFRNVNRYTSGEKDIKVTVDDVKYLSNICTKKLSLSGNNIAVFEKGLFTSLKYRADFEVLDLSHNQLQALTHVFALEEIILSLKSLRVLDLSYQPDMKEEEATPVGDTFFAMIKSLSNGLIIPPNLQVIKFSYVKPTKRFISFNSRNISKPNSLKEVDISFSNFRNIGTICGLDKLEKLDISGLASCNLTSDFFICMPGLKELRAEKANLGIKFASGNYRHFFTGLSNVNVLKLSSNQLTISNLPLLKDQEQSVERIDFSKNDFIGLPFDLALFRKINVLDLSYNSIESLLGTDTSQIDAYIKSHSNFKLYLKGNPMKCTCDQLAFVSWFCATKASIPDFVFIQCIDYQGNNRTFHRHFCGKLDIFRKDCVHVATLWLKLSISMLTEMLLTLLAAAILYRYKNEVRYLILRFCSRARRYQPIPHFKYDAFAAYSHRDDDWVCNTLRIRLERDHNLKLCLHQRNFIPGVPISHNIIDAIEQSRKVIFVVTHNSLRSDWAHFELEMANMHRSIRGRNNLIVILRDNIPYEDLPKTLRAIWRNTVCMVWPEREVLEATDQFWGNLVAAVQP